MRPLPAFPARLLVAALALVLSGCFQISSVLTVRPDGSATLRDEVTLSGFALMALEEAAEEGGEDPEEMFARADFEKRAAALGDGVALVSLEPSEGGYVAVYSVADVRRLRFSTPSLPSDDDDGTEADGGPLGDGVDLTFAFEEGDPATLRVVVPKPEPSKDEAPEADADGMVETEDDVDPADQARMMGMMRSFFGDARMTVQVEVEGEIVETTSAYADGSTVTLFDLPMSALFDLIEEEPELLEADDDEAALARLRAMEGVRMEGPGTVRVRFR